LCAPCQYICIGSQQGVCAYVPARSTPDAISHIT
jgi:hypothetical protein